VLLFLVARAEVAGPACDLPVLQNGSVPGTDPSRTAVGQEVGRGNFSKLAWQAREVLSTSLMAEERA